jgi:hypothetical protein
VFSRFMIGWNKSSIIMHFFLCRIYLRHREEREKKECSVFFAFFGLLFFSSESLLIFALCRKCWSLGLIFLVLLWLDVVFYFLEFCDKRICRRLNPLNGFRRWLKDLKIRLVKINISFFLFFFDCFSYQSNVEN